MRTVASQLFRSIAPVVVAVLLGGGLVLYLLIADRLENEFDEVLVTKARTLAALSEFENGTFEMERYELVSPGYVDPVDTEYFVIYQDGDRLLLASPGVGNDAWLRAVGDRHDDGSSYADIALPDGRSGRRFTLEFLPAVDDDTDEEEAQAELEDDVAEPVVSPLGPIVYEAPVASYAPLRLSVAVSREPLDALLTSIRFLLAGTGVAIAATILLVGRGAIRRRLEPLAEIGVRVSALDPSRPEQRLHMAPSSAEIDRLAERFDDLLERVEEAVVRERRFSSDVAHELRTPIAELRALAEVNARFPDDPTLRENFFPDQIRSIERMDRTVSNLLALTRDESGQTPSGPPCDLGALVRECVERAVGTADEPARSVRLTLPDSPFLTAGRDRWECALDNLIGNAVDHGTPGAPVDVVLEVKGDVARFAISNRTDELDEADLERLFDRLWRKDASRSSTRHSGLGLALVRACLGTLGLRVEATLTTEEGGARRLRMAIAAIPRGMPSQDEDVDPSRAPRAASPGSERPARVSVQSG